MDMFIFSEYVQIQGRKSPLQKFKEERVNLWQVPAYTWNADEVVV